MTDQKNKMHTMESAESDIKNKKSNVTIAKMTKEHIACIAKIEAEVFSVPWSAQAFADTLAMEHALFFAAVAGGEVAGYCGVFLAADEGEITNVAAAPGWRRQKIAERLLQKTMAEAHKKGAQRIFLEVRSLNEPAIGLYEKTGFHIVGRRKNYYRHPQDDALVMMYEYADI